MKPYEFKVGSQESKFKVGQVWKAKNGKTREITSINNVRLFYPIGDSEGKTYTREGVFYKGGPSPLDLVELVNDVTETGAKKDNVKDCKAPIKYVHPRFIYGIAYGMLAGELKYEAWNYIKGHDIQDLIDAAIRHLNKVRIGEIVDKDTTERLRERFGEKAPEVTHLDLAGCNLNMIVSQIIAGTIRNSWPEKLSDK